MDNPSDLRYEITEQYANEGSITNKISLRNN